MDKKGILSCFNNQKILIIGDVMIDAYMWGKVSRISPEAPVPIMEVEKREQRLGGAANVALNILSLGGKPFICSVLGNDENARQFKSIMDQNHMDCNGLLESPHRKTTIKTRVIGNNAHIVRVDEESTHPLTAEEEKQYISTIFSIIENQDIQAIIFQDYDKGCITPKVIEEVVLKANQKGIPTTVDPKHRNFCSFKGVTLFKPNLKELREGLNLEINRSHIPTLINDLEKAAQEIHQKQNISIVMTTLSHQGIFACDFRAGKPISIYFPAEERSISDVSGAGDTVISVATLALASGMRLEEIVRLSNLAGGIVCEQVGVVPINKDRLEEEFTK